jgi:uncharacterized membrane protein
MMTLPFENVFRYAEIFLTDFKYHSLGAILNLLIACVANAFSSLPRTIIQIQQHAINLYLDAYSSERNEVLYI